MHAGPKREVDRSPLPTDTDASPLQPAPDISAVILTTTARLFAHPSQIPMGETMGAFSVNYRGGFAGMDVGGVRSVGPLPRESTVIVHILPGLLWRVG